MAQEAFGKHTEAAARIYLQHWMCTWETGFLLHPEIPTNKENLKVADIACGTGIWLVDLARSVPASAQLDGFDLSTAHYPPKQFLPQNVNLQVGDALAPVPDHLVGIYDVVHVARIVLFVQNENPMPLIQNFMMMLKPGGYLHWDEVDRESMRAECADPSMPHPHYDELSAAGRQLLSARGISSKWVSDMKNIFTKEGLQVLDSKRLPISDSMAKPWTDMQLMANQDFIENTIIPLVKQTGASSKSPDQWRELLRNVQMECQQGMKITMDIVYTVAQKPISEIEN